MLLLFDLRAARMLARVSAGDSPNVMALDGGTHLLYFANESGMRFDFDEQGRGLRKLGEGYVAAEAHSVAVDPEARDI